MKLEEFLKIKKCTDLVDVTGGGSNSDYIKNKIEAKVMEMTATNKHPTDIKSTVEYMLKDYVIQSDDLEMKTSQAMKELGFKVQKK